ncbi:hypothetical protein F0170_00395 [Pseudomonas sp. MAFF 730085]|uniref:Uncharacterized protein n=1 Tax=Pseudomonas kitaguniensis TaxID=2607908 RepID=A0A5N7JMN4_9PSED|nr:hypothetical protein [Pseudomonas kitaguniensis]MPQ82581.1 hypothetical protein [Pseudomonas kitaguniensis]
MTKRRPARKGKKNFQPDTYQLLANPLTAGLLSPDIYQGYAATFIARYNGKDFAEKFEDLYKKDKFKSMFNAPALNIEAFFGRNIFISNVTRKRLLEMYLCILKAYAPKINLFVIAKHKFESAVLLGDFEDSLRILDAFAVDQGESLWYVRHKILVLGMKGEFQEMQDFAESCKLRSADGFVTFLINCFLLLATDPLLHLQKIILTTVNELEDAGLNMWADLIKLLFFPRPLFAEIEALTCLPLLQSFCVIDQYALVVKLVTEALAAEPVSEYIIGGQKELHSLILSLRSSISDDSLPDIERLQDKNLKNCSLALTLVSLYETDQYEALVEKFMLEFSRLKTPFAFANLIAKASVSSEALGASIARGPMFDLIEHLKCLYTLGVPPNQVESNISKIIVQLQAFVGCSQLQLCLYKAMPLRYKQQDWIKLARVARIATAHATPLSILLASDHDPILEDKYITNHDDLPRFRRLKSSIQSCDNPKDSEVLELLSYSVQPARLKDVFETISAYYLKFNRAMDLIALCAKTLAQQPNAYIAFPMSKLIEIIETDALSDVDSLIIIYYYVKKIDSHKEYLLNESYEAFIEGNEVSRPSDLLGELDISDDRVLVLIRDISTLETMDFLGAFSDSNDLRAERVRLLDYLRDVERIDPEAHRTEVDDIVVQVVVDAGATEFNVAKIDVNDAAIRRILAEDFSSLFALFKSVQHEKEQRTIMFDGDFAEGHSALVAGDKNTTLLKILNLVEDAFLNDEKHGLDKNLSTEIRHGFFSNLMRSKLEESNLITEVGENGEYESNVYWLSANALVSPELLVALDSELTWFSDSFNKLILKTEEWMKVYSDDGETTRVFRYRTFLDDFEVFKKNAALSDSADELLDYCLANLWERTELCMQEMREKLNVDFRSSVDSLFDELIERVNEAKSGVGLLELMSTIVQVKGDIKEDIATASEWFRRNTEYASTARCINDLVDISIECFERVKGVRLKVRKNFDDRLPVNLEGRHLKAFIVAIVNVLENACRHSGYSHGTEISISLGGCSENWFIVIENNLAAEKVAILQEDSIERITKKMKAPSSLGMMRKEGGTGLSKAYNQLKLISANFDLYISVVSDAFVTRISHVS